MLLSSSPLGDENGPTVELLILISQLSQSSYKGYKPVVGITEVKTRVAVSPSSYKHSIVFPAVFDVTVTLSCEV